MSESVEMRQVIAHIQTRLDSQENEIKDLSAKLQAQDAQVEDVRLTMNGRLDGVEARLNARIDTFEQNLTQALQNMELRILAARSTE